MRFCVSLTVILLIAGGSTVESWADDAASSTMPLELRAWYSAPQSEWPKARVDDSVVAKPLKALPMGKHASERSATESARVELGKFLFFEPFLSGSGQHACASCHDPYLGWADGRRFSFGHNRQQGQLNAPTILNTAFLPEIFWDGRADTLEEQAVASIVNPVEMAGEADELVERLRAITGYRERFADAFEDAEISMANVASAIADFVRTRNTPNTPFDKFMRGEHDALNDQELWGLHLFRTKAGCMNCHNGQLLSDGKYHHLGTSFYGVGNFEGRYAVTGESADFSAFRTAPLRNVAATGPYMNSGLIDSLEHVLGLYNIGWWQNAPTDACAKDPRFAKLSPLIKPLELKQEELKALEAFLLALGNGGSKMGAPELPR